MLEFHLEQVHEFDGEAGGASDAHNRKCIGFEDLLHVSLGDDVAHRRAAITGHDDP